MNTEAICTVIFVAVCSRYTDEAARSAMRRMNAAIVELHEAKKARDGVDRAREAFRLSKLRALASVALDALVLLFIAAAIAATAKATAGVFVVALVLAGVGATVRAFEEFDLFVDVLGAEECDCEEGR